LNFGRAAGIIMLGKPPSGAAAPSRLGIGSSLSLEGHPNMGPAAIRQML